MKISDEAVEAALAAYLADNAAGAEREDAMRAALAAAVPYLMPDREARHYSTDEIAARIADRVPHADLDGFTLSERLRIGKAVAPLFQELLSEVPSDQPCLGDGVCTNPKCPVHGIKEDQ